MSRGLEGAHLLGHAGQGREAWLPSSWRSVGGDLPLGPAEKQMLPGLPHLVPALSSAARGLLAAGAAQGGAGDGGPAAPPRPATGLTLDKQLQAIYLGPYGAGEQVCGNDGRAQLQLSVWEPGRIPAEALAWARAHVQTRVKRDQGSRSRQKWRPRGPPR